MPTYRELVETYLRDFEGYAGDGRGGRGTLPTGDMTTASRPIYKRDLRELFLAWDGGANVPEFRIEDFRDVEALANATLTYGPGSGQVQSGDIVRTRAEGFSYRVAASTATDHHITAGSVKLYVTPLWGGQSGGIHMPEAWNYKGDGSSNDHAILTRMFAAADGIVLNSGKTYFGNSGTITLTRSIGLIGNGAEFRDLYFSGQGADGVDFVDFDNVKFTTARTPTSSTVPPYSFNIRNVDRVRLHRCIFDGVMAYIATDDTVVRYGIDIEGCRFVMDGSSWNWTGPQLDQLTILGYRHVRLVGNFFNAKNVNRILKVSVGLTIPLTPAGNPVPNRNVRGLYVAGNWIIGRCDPINGLPGGKQIIDCYTGTTESTFDDNFFDCLGFSSCIENKTGFAYADANMVNSHKITKNRFYLDCPAYLFQGSYGLVSLPGGAAAASNSRDTLYIAGNTGRFSGPATAGASIRFFHQVVIGEGEDFSTDGGIVGFTALDISSCEEIKLLGNSAKGGAILIAEATSNASSSTFNGKCKRIICKGGNSIDYGQTPPANMAGVQFRELPAVDSLILEGWTASTQFDDARLMSAFWVRGCTIKSIIVTGNVANHPAAPAKELVRVTDSVIEKFTETDNSWEPARKNLANTATPSVKATSSGSVLSNGGNQFQTGGATPITDLLDGYVGQEITIYSNQNATVTHSTNIKLNGGVNFAMNLYDTLTLMKVSATVWVETARSVN